MPIRKVISQQLIAGTLMPQSPIYLVDYAMMFFFFFFLILSVKELIINNKMGISSGTSRGWLFVHCVQIKLEFGNVGF